MGLIVTVFISESENSEGQQFRAVSSAPDQPDARVLVLAEVAAQRETPPIAAVSPQTIAIGIGRGQLQKAR